VLINGVLLCYQRVSSPLPDAELFCPATGLKEESEHGQCGPGEGWNFRRKSSNLNYLGKKIYRNLALVKLENLACSQHLRLRPTDFVVQFQGNRSL
jgi:hypothetical protein